ncbi:tripartite tricarboxylate transporter TctB family protein [Streptomyces flavofungini]|uniref:tripartite tricarboxylate transporter TctB family protein n=1 Tax=Streptomyces flavofungini TaxID=68200 RepID=UPI0025B0C96C|nr:tripartite tricarboxylate transporter TctB family protein [Streptomyces flavofungini]WJV49735.1 tripartite tricarboxylate transporter TctB family protein [Streptomyces flavofungini]
MTTTEPPAERTATRRAWLREHSELGVCVLLLALGTVVLTDALTMDVALTQRGPVGPRTVPVAVGVGLLVVSVLLAVDVLRGGSGVPREARPAGAVVGRRAGETEGGEGSDAIDVSEPADWRTVLLLAGVFLATAVLIEPVGFPVAGALLFWGAAYALGSRAVHRDPLIAAGLSLATYALFNNLLGVPLPGGPLMGVL